MKELMHAHEAKKLADNMNGKVLYDIKTAITGEILEMVNKDQYKAFIFFEGSNYYRYKNEIIEWLENKGHNIKITGDNE